MSRYFINPKTKDVTRLQPNEVGEFPGYVPLDEYVTELQDIASKVVEDAEDSAQMKPGYKQASAVPVTWKTVNKARKAIR
jgi:thioredoxin-related protein